MAERTESVVPAEADIDRALGLLEGAMSLDLTPQTCNLEYWLGAVAQGTLRGLVHGGHRAEAVAPTWMREPGPLRQALIEEFAFRSIADPAAAEIERAAGIDEIRHLTVGSAIIGQYVRDHPGELGRLKDLIERGRAMWGGLPVLDMILRREKLFQEGVQQLRHVVGDYELTPGKRLIDSTPEERLMLAATWSVEMQDNRLASMGLG